MGIDLAQWRVRIGTFCQSARLKPFLPVLKIGKITIAIRLVLFLLLVVHGVESNPGPGYVSERSCSQKRQCRCLSFDGELRKPRADGNLLIDETNIHKTAKIRPITVLLKNDSVSHELSTIKPQSQSQHDPQLQPHHQPLYLLDCQNRTESLSQPQSHSQPLYQPEHQNRPEAQPQLQSNSQTLYLPDHQKLSESQSLFQSHSQPLYLHFPQNRHESQSQTQSHQQPRYLPDPQNRPKSQSQLLSHSQPLYLPDQQNRSESLSQPQSHSQLVYLPDPRNRPEQQSNPQSHSQPLYLPDPKNRPESQSQPQSHCRPHYLNEPQKRSETLSQLQLHSQSLFLSDPQKLSESESLSQMRNPQNRSEFQLQSQSHSQPQNLPDPQKRSQFLSEPQSHSQPLYLSDPLRRSESQSLLQSPSQTSYLPDPNNRSESLFQTQSHFQPLNMPDPQNQSESQSQPQSNSKPLYQPDQQKRSESLSQPQSHSQHQYLPDPQNPPESQPKSYYQPQYMPNNQKRSQFLSLRHSLSPPLCLHDHQKRSESQSQLQSISHPLYLHDPQNRCEYLSQPQSDSKPLYLPDPQNQLESQSQPQSHSEPLYLQDEQNQSQSLSQTQSVCMPDPQNRTESQLQSDSQPLSLPDPQNYSESLSQPQSHSQPLYLPDHQNLSQCQSQLQFHTQSQLQPNSPPLSRHFYLSYPHSNPQSQEISHSQILCQSLLPSQSLPHSQAQPHSQSQPHLQPLPHHHSLSQAHPHSQLLSQSHIWPASKLQPHLLCHSQLQSQSLCTSQESIMNVLNSYISSELQLLKKMVDSLKAENASLNRRVEDLETFKERVTKAEKGTDIIKEDRTGREENNPKSRNTEKANAVDDYAGTNQAVRHLGKPSVYQEGDRMSGTESNNYCLSDIREEDDDADEHSSDEVVNSNVVQLLSSENMKLTLAEEFEGLLDEGINSAVMKNVGQNTDVAKNLLMKSLKSWIDTDSITKVTEQNIIILLEQLCNMFMSSKRYDKGSSDNNKWYLNWSSDHFLPRDYDCFVFAIPFNISFRIIPLPPRRFNAQNNNMYQYECVRLASFSTYRGRGFGVVFAQAGFVFDPAINMVLCPFCKVVVHSNVNIINIHLADCVILHINIPFHNVSSLPVSPENRRACRQVGGVNFPPILVQMPNRQLIGRSCSRIRSEHTPALPVTGKKGGRSQEHARRGSTEQSSGLNSHGATLPVAIGRPNQTGSFTHATPSPSTSSGTGKSSAFSVHSCTVRNCTCSTDVTGSLNQCHPCASEHKATVPSGSSKRADYSTDSTHVVFSEPSSRGNGNTWNHDSVKMGHNDKRPIANSSQQIRSINTESMEEPPPKYSQYAEKNTRINSFCRWPAKRRQRPQELAECGFYYTGHSDRVRCFDCGVGLEQWTDEDDPWVEHIRLSPSCRYVHKIQGQEWSTAEISERKAARERSGGNVCIPNDHEEVTAAPKNKERRGEKTGRSSASNASNGSRDNSRIDVGNNILCKICEEGAVCVVFLPCFHMVTCQNCSRAFRKCIICRTLIKATINAFTKAP